MLSKVYRPAPLPGQPHVRYALGETELHREGVNYFLDSNGNEYSFDNAGNLIWTTEDGESEG